MKRGSERAACAGQQRRSTVALGGSRIRRAAGEGCSSGRLSGCRQSMLLDRAYSRCTCRADTAAEQRGAPLPLGEWRRRRQWRQRRRGSPGLRSWLGSSGGGQSCSPSSAAAAAAKGLGFASSSESLSSLRRPASTAADRWIAARCWAAMARPSRSEALRRCSIARGAALAGGWRAAAGG